MHLQMVLDDLKEIMEVLHILNGGTEWIIRVRQRCVIAIEQIAKHDWAAASVSIGQAMLAWEPARTWSDGRGSTWSRSGYDSRLLAQPMPM